MKIHGVEALSEGETSVDLMQKVFEVRMHIEECETQEGLLATKQELK